MIKLLLQLLNIIPKEQDPLDELLEEKGVNPDTLMRQLEKKREIAGDDDTMNRIKSRNEYRKKRNKKSNEVIGGTGS